MKNPDYHDVMFNAVCYVCLTRIHIAESPMDPRPVEEYNCKHQRMPDGHIYTLWYHLDCEKGVSQNHKQQEYYHGA